VRRAHDRSIVLNTATRCLLAVAIGVAVGFERERHRWAHDHDRAEPIGARTLGLVALSGALAASHSVAAAATVGAVVGALVLLSYYQFGRSDPGLTTEMAAVTVFLLGVLSVDRPRDAAALGVAVLVLLKSKDRIQQMVKGSITNEEFDDALKYAAFSVIVLPLLPDRAYDDSGVINPRQIWLKVLLLAGISFAGYVAARLLGPKRGIAATGVAGGFVSAAATTSAMASRAKRSPSEARPALAGAFLASAVTCVQIVIVTGALSRPLAGRLAGPCAAGAAVLVTAAWRTLRQSRGEEAESASIGRPLNMTGSITLAGVLTAALWLSQAASDRFGSSGVTVTAAATGLADAHAAALVAAQFASGGTVSVSSAVAAVGAGLATNTMVKLVIAVMGGRRFARVFIPVVLGAAVVTAAGFVLAA
jgi:uncharacterized membrane protein (DUF4010 family)